MSGHCFFAALVAATTFAWPVWAVATRGTDGEQRFYLAGMKPASGEQPSASRPVILPPEPGLLIDDKTPLKIKLPGRGE